VKRRDDVGSGPLPRGIFEGGAAAMRDPGMLVLACRL